MIHTLRHKTSRSASLKCTLLRIIIPARGVDGSLFAKQAIDLLIDLGLPVDGGVDGPLFPAPTGDGAFMKRGLILLGEPAPGHSGNAEVISSHSLKATCLSWCAKFGLTPSTRSMLGRHASCINDTFAIYSRDLMVAPAVELQGVIDRIADGSFAPDAPRSMFFGSGVRADAPPPHAPVKSEPEDLDGGFPGQVVEIEPSEGAATSGISSEAFSCKDTAE